MRALLRPLQPYWARVALTMGLSAAVVASNMGLLAAAAYLVAAASVTHLMATLILPMYAVRILSVTRGSARYLERLWSHRITLDLLARLRLGLYDRFRLLGPAGMQGTRSGDALGRVLADVEDLQDAYLLVLAPIAAALAVSALLLGVLLAVDGTLAVATLPFVLACGLALPAAVGMLSRGAGHEAVTARADLNVLLVDTIQGSRDLVSNGAGARYRQEAAVRGRRIAGAEARLAALGAGREGMGELLTNLAMLTALALAVPLVTRHAISPLYLAVPALLVLAAFEAIRPLGQAAESVSGVRAAGRRVHALGEGITPLRPPAAPAPLLPPYSIAFAGVTMAYGDPDLPALREVTFHVPEGRRVAVVGPSGAGKTTLMRLLTREWAPTAGTVSIGSRDVRAYALHDLRATIGVVSQDTYIFNDTIRSNLLLAQPDASAGELEAALESVELLELVHALPGGLDTWVGEHGERLSGGERQRLAVARLLLRDAPIVLLDEVTANLDAASERALLDMLERVTAGRTVLVVTHRLIGLDRMDEIVVLDRGRVVERGTHAELRAAHGLYRALLDVQEDMLVL